ncbi:hypothetical protein GGR88_000823 [Sphingomonas jejuensis]|uniref:Peptidase inhibitor I78 family protein n=1 Tax=Sphingomonas jejuensis TaxID=904715 RepID=A0ABX0XJE0_9SPHN|nr:I78 family peptidase inhibitor [Sphingomonas jejuensis]NJC33349.1 hypothetical protein [Sphingomonas jejuensis]
MTKLLAALPLIAIAGCTTTAATPDGAEGAEPGPVIAGEGRCNAAATADLVGRPADAALGAEVLRRTGARTLRWIQRGTAVTMDYRTDRANVTLDDAGRVEGVRCG